MDLNEIVMQSKNCVFNKLYYAQKIVDNVLIKFPEFVLHVFIAGMTLQKLSLRSQETT